MDVLHFVIIIVAGVADIFNVSRINLSSKKQVVDELADLQVALREVRWLRRRLRSGLEPVKVASGTALELEYEDPAGDRRLWCGRRFIGSVRYEGGITRDHQQIHIVGIVKGSVACSPAEVKEF